MIRLALWWFDEHLAVQVNSFMIVSFLTSLWSIIIVNSMSRKKNSGMDLRILPNSVSFKPIDLVLWIIGEPNHVSVSRDNNAMQDCGWLS